jgi:hypothetical protein
VVGVVVGDQAQTEYPAVRLVLVVLRLVLFL